MITWHTERTHEGERLRYGAHTTERAGYISPDTFCGHGGRYTYVVDQTKQDEPRLYTWGFTELSGKRCEAIECSISEETMLNICGRPPHTGSWGFTFVRLDP